MITKFLFFCLILFTTSAMSQTIKDSTVIEVLPQYPRGSKKLLKYVNKNLHVPTSVNKARYQGVIVVGFMIDRDGGVIAESIDLQRMVFDKRKISEADKSLVQEELVTEVKRLFANMPKWAPGTQNGIAVRVRYKMPLTIDFG